MKVSAALRTLAQCPGSYPLEVDCAGLAAQILAIEYSHDPARALIRLEPIPANPAPSILCDFAELIHKIECAREIDPTNKHLEDTQQMLKGAQTCWRKFVESQEPAATPAPVLPEPEATIAELNGEIPPVPVPVEPAGEPLGDEPETTST